MHQIQTALWNRLNMQFVVMGLASNTGTEARDLNRFFKIISNVTSQQTANVI